MSVPVRIAEQDAAQGCQSTTSATAPQLSDLKIALKKGIRQYSDFPKKGILFEDILPLFSDINLHTKLIDAFELQIKETLGAQNKPDVIVGLDARGFLFGPSIALRIGAGFVPVRKPNKLPGQVHTATYTKEYGEDSFAIQQDAIKKGQKVLIVDDLIATGGSASAAGSLVKQSGGDLLGYMFIIELQFLNGRSKLEGAPVHTLLESQS